MPHKVVLEASASVRVQTLATKVNKSERVERLKRSRSVQMFKLGVGVLRGAAGYAGSKLD